MPRHVFDGVVAGALTALGVAIAVLAAGLQDASAEGPNPLQTATPDYQATMLADATIKTGVAEFPAEFTATAGNATRGGSGPGDGEGRPGNCRGTDSHGRGRAERHGPGGAQRHGRSAEASFRAEPEAGFCPSDVGRGGSGERTYTLHAERCSSDRAARCAEPGRSGGHMEMGAPPASG